MRLTFARGLATAAAIALLPTSAHAISFVNALTVANGTDLSDYMDPANNRLGGFGSDLVYDAASDLYYGLTDRGPGGGTISYAPRIQVFSLDTNAATGAISNFTLRDTIVFHRADGTTFNGLNPTELNGTPRILGNSLDSEGMAKLANGNFLISDEYGPSLYEFSADGTFVREFTIPENIKPKEANGDPNFTDGRPTITTGRQDNRGFEGLTVSPDGTKAYAVLQDPLVNEGTPDGRRSQNVRIVEFDVASGEATKQVIYQLDNIADLNAGPEPDFAPNDQGRSIGVSSILALGGGKFLVLERDNRGLGVETLPANTPVSKRVYIIDINGASDVSNTVLTANALPNGVTPVTKESVPLVDLVATLRQRGLPVPEKVEGFTFGEELADGGRTLILITDNDYSVTQTFVGIPQADVCFTNGLVTGYVPIGQGCAAGSDLLPNFLYSFKLSRDEYRALVGLPAVPEPATWAAMILGMGAVGGVARRRRTVAVAA